jgi:FSR family fosmidomycin resistance protein-like MFS transporter
MIFLLKWFNLKGSTAGTVPIFAKVSNAFKNNWILFDTSVAHFLNDGLSFFPAYLAAIIAINYDYSYLQIALIIAAYQFMGALISPVVGAYIDSAKKKGVLMALGLIFFALSYLLIVAPYPGNIAIYGFIISMAVIGIFSTFYHPIGSMILNLKYKNRAGTVLGINGIGGSLGRTLAPGIFLAYMVLTKNYKTALILMMVSFAAVGIYLLYDLRKDIFFVEKKKKGRMRYSTPILILLLVVILRSIALNGGVVMIPTYFTKSLKYNELLVGIIIMIAYASAIFGQPLLGYFSDRFGRRLMIFSTAAIFGVSVIAMVYETGIIPITITLIITYFVGLTGFPLIMSIVGDLSDVSSLAEMSALIFGLGGGIGAGIGTFFLGFLSDQYGSRFGFIVIGAIAIISSLIVFLIPRKQK